MNRKNGQVPSQGEPPSLRQVRYVVTTAPRTSDPVDGYYAAFRDGFFLCTGKGASREEAIADLLPKLEEYLLREWQESKHRLLPTPLSSDEEVSSVVISIPDVFGERYALPDEQRRKRLQERPRVAIYLQKIPDRLPASIKKHFASWLSECRTYATQQGWQVVAIYDEADTNKGQATLRPSCKKMSASPIFSTRLIRRSDPSGSIPIQQPGASAGRTTPPHPHQQKHRSIL